MKKCGCAGRQTLILFAVDASWSTGSGRAYGSRQGAIMSLLTDAPISVGIASASSSSARTTLIWCYRPPIPCSWRGQALADIAVGSKRPLSARLMMAHEVFRKESYTPPGCDPHAHFAD
ncbi:MAG: hypothetical protein M5U34_15735 [Chloroflexi bacterium]|nr:hypothetical protein [Chloroflexota bacterium]